MPSERDDLWIQVEPINRGREARIVRVFVSSTFRDMDAEREVLMKHVFPALRNRCRERRLEFVAVDLRWGITAEQVEKGELLPLILGEIDRCRPYFLGLLGHYYGYVVPRVPSDVAARYPWLEGAAGTSITELEILHGVLDHPESTQQSMFFFRGQEYLDQLPPDQREAWCSQGDSAAKLLRLKSRIKAAGLCCRDYGAPSQLGPLVEELLWAQIDRDYPLHLVPDKDEEQRLQHDEFAQRLTRIYVGSKALHAKIDAHVAGSGPPLVIEGTIASGKSALLANWIRAKKVDQSAPALVTHFVQCQESARAGALMLTRLMKEILRVTGLQYPLPENPDRLILAFTDLLHRVGQHQRLVIVVDGADQIQHDDHFPPLAWLPPEAPENVRIILSTRPGATREEARRRRYPILDLQPLAATARVHLIEHYFARQGRKLDPANLNAIAQSPATGSPLYLSALLEELTVFGHFERLHEQIGRLLAATAIEQLYDQILARWEADFEVDSAGLVKNVLTCLWASRRGLPESDLLFVAGHDLDRVKDRFWSPLRLAAEEMLVESAGVFQLANEAFAQAVAARYLDHAGTAAAHARIVAYYRVWTEVQVGFTFLLSEKNRHLEKSVRQHFGTMHRQLIEDLPWQYLRAEAWPDLAKFLGNLKYLHEVFDESPTDAFTYWHALAEHGFSMVETYRNVLANPQRATPAQLASLIQLLRRFGHIQEALVLQSRQSERLRAAGDAFDSAQTLIVHAELLALTAEFAKAEALLQEAEQLHRADQDELGAALAVAARGTLYYQQDDFAGAKACWLNAQLVFQRERALPWLGRTKNNLAGVFLKEGKLLDALKLLKHAEQIHRRFGPLTDLGRALHNQGFASLANGDVKKAVAQFTEAEETFRRGGALDEAGGCRDHIKVIEANADRLTEIHAKLISDVMRR